MAIRRPASDTEAEWRPTGLQSVGRALAVLEALARNPEGATPKALRAELGFSLGAVYHLLHALVDAGYALRCPETGLFRLGTRIPHLNEAFLRPLRPARAVLPFLQALQQATGETAHLARLYGDQVVAVALVQGADPEAVPGGYLGFGFPAHEVAIGRVLLAWSASGSRENCLARLAEASGAVGPFARPDVLRAELKRVRAAGLAVDRDRDHLAWCVAAPIPRDNGPPLEAMSVIATPERFARNEPALVAAVRAVTAAAAMVAAPEAAPAAETAAPDDAALRRAIEAAWRAAALPAPR